MAPGDISPFFDSKATCEALARTTAASKYQDSFCGDDNRENRERLLRDLGVEDETTPQGRDVLRRHQAWYNDKKRKERQGNLKFKQIAQERLDENNWPDEEEEEEEEDVDQDPGLGHGQGLGQDNEGGGGDELGGEDGEDGEESIGGGLFEDDGVDPGFGLGGEDYEEQDDNAEAVGVGGAVDGQRQIIVSGNSDTAIARVYSFACRALVDSLADVTSANNNIVRSNDRIISSNNRIVSSNNATRDKNQTNLQNTQKSIENMARFTLNLINTAQ